MRDLVVLCGALCGAWAVAGMESVSDCKQMESNDLAMKSNDSAMKSNDLAMKSDEKQKFSNGNQ